MINRERNQTLKHNQVFKNNQALKRSQAFEINLRPLNFEKFKKSIYFSLLAGLLVSITSFAPGFLHAAQKDTVVNSKADTKKETETAATTGATTTATPSKRLDPKAALKRLMEGNNRFTHDKATCPDRNQVRRAAIVAKQKPFAIVLGCSDSRVPPELAFDQGLGDIFVIRVAGNVVSAIELASIEYSALLNDSSIIVVLGHENCGAVDAVMKGQTQGFEAITNLIKRAVDSSHDNLQNAVIANVKNSMELVKASPVISKIMNEGKIDVVGGYYSLSTGKVMLLDKT